MEQLVIEVAKQAPSLCVLAWIVTKFLGVLRSMQEAQEKMTVSYNAAIRENSVMLGRVEQALESLPRERKVSVQT